MAKKPHSETWWRVLKKFRHSEKVEFVREAFETEELAVLCAESAARKWVHAFGTVPPVYSVVKVRETVIEKRKGK